MEIEKSLLKVAEHLKAYADEKDQQILDTLKQASTSVAELAELIKAIPAGDKGDKGDTGEKGEQGPAGEKGEQGPAGDAGKSVTTGEVVFSLKADDDFQEYLKSLKGEKGDKGEDGRDADPAVIAKHLSLDLDFIDAVTGPIGPTGDAGPQGEQGPAGEKGADGASVSLEEVVSTILSNEDFTKSLIGPQGEKGDSGPQGLQGDQGPQGPAGEKGEDGLSIKAFEIDEETGALLIEMSDGQVADLGVIKGKDGQNGQDGKDFDAAAFYNLFKSDSELISSLKATPEALREELLTWFDAANKTYINETNNTLESLKSQVVSKLESVDEYLAQKEASLSSAIEEIELVKSESKLEVEDATNELVAMSKAALTEQLSAFDAVIDEAQGKITEIQDSIEQINTGKTITWQPDILVKSGQWVEHEGRYYVCNRDTDSIPGNSSAYSMVLRGFEFKKAWNNTNAYQRLDVVISSTGSAWIANKDNPQGEPGSTPDWNLMVKRGERGAKGEVGDTGPQGEKGSDGVGISDISFDYAAEELHVVKTDGSVEQVDMPLFSMVKEMVGNAWIIREKDFELPINDFRGAWHSSIGYKRGDVVQFMTGLFIAAKDTTEGVAPIEPVTSERFKKSNVQWKNFVMIPGDIGGGGASGTGMPAQTTLNLGVATATANANPVWSDGWGLIHFAADANARRAMGMATPGAIVYQTDTGDYWKKTITGWSLFSSGGLPIYQNLTVPRAATAPNGEVAIIKDDTIGYTNVNRIQAKQNGLWAAITNHTEVKTRSVANPLGAVKGDLAISTDRNHTLVEVWDGLAWQIVHDDDDIARRIAASRSFRGTVVEPGNQQIGSNQLSQLIPESALTLADVGNYWTYTGRDGFVIPANSIGGLPATFSIVTPPSGAADDPVEFEILTAGTSSVSITVSVDIDGTTATEVVPINRADTPDDIADNIATAFGLTAGIDATVAGDIVMLAPVSGETLTNLVITVQSANASSRIDGAGLTPGDWIQVYNAGGDGQGTNPAPDLHYTIIHGDILSASRAANLFGLGAWNAGATYEQNSLVNYAGDIWKAVSNVVANQAAPSASSTLWQLVPIYGNMKFVANNAALATITNPSAGTAVMVLSDALNANQPTLYVYANNRWTPVGGSLANLSDTAITNVADGDQLYWDTKQAKWVNKPASVGGLGVWQNGRSYNSNDLVWYNNKFWKSKESANTLEPGVASGPPKGTVFAKFVYISSGGKEFKLSSSWDNHIPTFVHAFPPLDGTTQTMWQFKYDPTAMGDEWVDRDTSFGYWLEQHAFDLDTFGMVYNPNDKQMYFLNHGRDNLYVSRADPSLNYEGMIGWQTIRQLTPPADAQITINIANGNGLGSENSRCVFWVYDDPTGTAAPPTTYEANGYNLPTAGGGKLTWDPLDLSLQPEHAQVVNQARYMTQAEYNALSVAQRVGMIVIVG